MTPAPQPQQEYTTGAIDDRLFRIERLAYECILNHPESKEFCTEIKHISSELREAIRSRSHTSTPQKETYETSPENISYPEWMDKHDTHTRTTERNATLDIINKGKDALYQIMPDGYWDQVLQAKFDVLLWVEEQVRKGDRP
jgi:hypothetical protein